MNIWTDEWDETDDWSAGDGKSKRLVGSGPQLGASLYELGPGNSVVYHFHHGSEELLIVLKDGRPSAVPKASDVNQPEPLAWSCTFRLDRTARTHCATRPRSSSVCDAVRACVEYPDLEKITALRRRRHPRLGPDAPNA